MTEGADGVGGLVPPALPSRLLAALACAALLLDMPALFTRGDVLRWVLVGFVAAAAAALGALAPARRVRVPTWALLLLPLAVPALALLGGPPPTTAAALRLAAPWILLAAATAGLLRVRSGDAASRELLLGLAWAGAVAGLWVILDRGAHVGPFGRPGVAGPVLAALFAAALVRDTKPWVRIVTAGLPFFGVLLTGSRVGLVAAVLGGLLALAVATRGGRARWVRVALVGSTAGFVLLFAAAAGGHVEIPGSSETVQVRTGLWSATSRLAAERPAAGHGLGTFPAEILRVRDLDEARLSKGRRPKVAHNDVLQVAAEGGVFAGLALALWGALLVLAGLRRGRAVEVGLLATILIASLGENILLDPAGVLLAALGATGILAARPAEPGRPSFPGSAVLLVLAFLALGSTTVLARDLLADRQVRRYRDGLPAALLPVDRLIHAQEHLANGALRWRKDHAVAWYRLGALQAKGDAFPVARASFQEALAADPGMTEARLDAARTWELEGRPEEAREALLEAARKDPTRFDIPIRLGHLALGREPIPGEAPGEDYQPVRALRHYNEARILDPERFEVLVAEARLARRQGDLPQTSRLLQEALRQVAPRAARILAEARSSLAGLTALATRPETAEILLESFRLAEREGTTPDAWLAGVLELALTVDPRLGGTLEAEAESQMTIGQARIADAKTRAARTPLVPADYTAARRALDAASLRFAGLLRAGRIDPEDLLRLAERAVEARTFRAAYARYRALLAWASLQPRHAGKDGAAHLDKLADLFSDAAKVARRVDAKRAGGLYVQAHAFAGAAAMARGEIETARRLLEDAAKDAPADADIRLGYARVLWLDGDEAAAKREIDEVLKLRPDWEEHPVVHEVRRDGSAR